MLEIITQASIATLDTDQLAFEYAEAFSPEHDVQARNVIYNELLNRVGQTETTRLLLNARKAMAILKG